MSVPVVGLGWEDGAKDPAFVLVTWAFCHGRDIMVRARSLFDNQEERRTRYASMVGLGPFK